MNVEKEWLETMKVLILYKFADKGTAETTADEIWRIFNKKEGEGKK